MSTTNGVGTIDRPTTSGNAVAITNAIAELQRKVTAALNEPSRYYGRFSLEIFVLDSKITGHEVGTVQTRKHQS